MSNGKFESSSAGSKELAAKLVADCSVAQGDQILIAADYEHLQSSCGIVKYNKSLI